MTKPKPPTPLQKLQHVVNPVDSTILASCRQCGKKLNPDEEYYLHRNTGVAILCSKHYDKISRMYE